MTTRKTRIGVVAPAAPLDRAIAEKVAAIVEDDYGAAGASIAFHPQCFLRSGHFAGDDAARTAAFVEMACDPAIDAIWFGRGGYGAGRLDAAAIDALDASARSKTYLGYSDLGVLLGRLYRNGFARLFHGPMPADIQRDGGDAAVRRALDWLVSRDRSALEPSLGANAPSIAFNITVLAHMVGTDWAPDLSGHELLLEDVSEYLYRVDRAMFAICESGALDNVAGVRLGRVSDVPENDRPFGESAEDIVRRWCAQAGVQFLGAVDIGHDAANRIVPFGYGEPRANS